MSRGPVCGVDCSLLTTTAHLMSSDRRAVGSPGQSNSSFMSPGRVDTHDLHRTHGGGHPATQEPQSCSAPWGSQEETPAEVSLASSPMVATLPNSGSPPRVSTARTPAPAWQTGRATFQKQRPQNWT